MGPRCCGVRLVPCGGEPCPLYNAAATRPAARAGRCPSFVTRLPALVARFSPAPDRARLGSKPTKKEPAMPKTHAIRIEKTGGPEQLKWVEVDLPAPGKGEV